MDDHNQQQRVAQARADAAFFNEQRRPIHLREPELFAAILSALREADLAELMDLGCPDDEYSPEVPDIIRGLPNTNGPEEVADLVSETFRQWFNESKAFVRARERYVSVGDAIWAIWQSHQAQRKGTWFQITRST